LILESNEYVALGKTISGELRIKFTLHTIPTEKWTMVFNRYNERIESILGSKSIIITAPIEQMSGKNVVDILIAYIHQADEEIANQTLRETVMKATLTSGYVIIHDNLSYVTPVGGKSQYQLYLESVQGRRIVV
jgi:hypothetical protein